MIKAVKQVASYDPIKICGCGEVYDCIPGIAALVKDGRMNAYCWDCTKCKSFLCVKREVAMMRAVNTAVSLIESHNNMDKEKKAA